jgi:hypothetical protein
VIGVTAPWTLLCRQRFKLLLTALRQQLLGATRLQIVRSWTSNLYRAGFRIKEDEFQELLWSGRRQVMIYPRENDTARLAGASVIKPSPASC